MAASFPNAKKTFSAVVNGVTKLVAALFNAGYDEIEAVQTFLGPTGGGAQSYYTSLTDMLINYRRGCAVEYKGDADLYVRAGEIMIVDASGNRRLRRNPSDTTVTWSDIDAGSEANSTQYYVYACADNNATTFTVKISTNASAPSGTTYYRRIGSFYNNASGNINNAVDFGDRKSWYVGKQVYADADTAVDTWTDLDLSPWIGVRRCRVFLKVVATSIADVRIRTNGQTEDVALETSSYMGGGVSAGTLQGNGCVIISCLTDASGVIEWNTLAEENMTITLEDYTVLE